MKAHLKSIVSPLAAALLLGLVLPVVCVLWFMLNTIENQGIASLKRLEDLYRRDAVEALLNIESDLLQTVAVANNDAAPVFFSNLVADKAITTAIIWDENFKKRYPQDVRPSEDIYIQHPSWRLAQRAEFTHKQYRKAQNYYIDVLKNVNDAQEKIAAHAAIGRVAYKREDWVQAIHQQNQILALYRRLPKDNRTAYQDQAAADALYQTINIAKIKSDGVSLDVAKAKLRALLINYSDYTLPAPKRLFLMSRLRQELGRDAQFETLILSEQIAQSADLLSLKENPMIEFAGHSYLNLYIESHKVSVLIEKSIFNQWYAGTLTQRSSGYPLSFKFLARDEYRAPTKNQVLYLPLEGIFDGVSIQAYWTENEAQNTLSNTGITHYIWIGSAAIIVLVVLYFYVALQIRKREQIQKLRSDVVATISHELKTPLTSIRLLIDNLQKDKYTLPSHIVDYLDIISNENYRLSTLVDNFMLFSRIERGKYKPTNEVTYLADTIGNCVSIVKYKYADRKIEFGITEENKEICTYIDPSLLKTAVINLIDNACKYSDDDTPVLINIVKLDKTIQIRVTDQGIGIKPKDKDKIFDRFYRVDQSLSRQAEGCGLGLNISRHIIQMQGGDILVDSKPMTGSTFTIVLPTNER